MKRVHADAPVLLGELAAAQNVEDEAFAASEKCDAPESPTRRHRNLTRPDSAPVKRK